MKKTVQALESSLSSSPASLRSGARVGGVAAADLLVPLSTIMSTPSAPRQPPPRREAKRYANRPSPAFPASSAPGMVHVGGDKQRWVSVALPARKSDTTAESPKVVYTWRRLAL